MGFGDAVAKALEVMRDEKKYYKDYLPEDAIRAGAGLIEATAGLWEDVLETVLELLKAEMPEMYPHVGVWWYSVLIEMKKDPATFFEFIKFVRNNRDAFSVNTQYFLFYQLKAIQFRFQALDSVESKEELLGYFAEVVDAFSKQVHASLQWIPADQRDKDLVLVFTEQLLVVQHGPTKTALDRCKALITCAGKRVLLINTGEIASSVGMIPFTGAFVGNYAEEMCSEKEQVWKGVTIPYFQCAKGMPDMDELSRLLADIRSMAPYCAVSIGGSGMLSNLVSRILPVLTVGLCPSDLEFTTTQFQTLGRKITEQDDRLLHVLGRDRSHIIESVFTSSLKPQTEKITRGELRISERTFLMVVIGARLDFEVSEEFLEMLDQVIRDGMHIAFLGKFQNYDKVIAKYPQLRAHASYLGYCDDILSRLEVSDLYINPIRRGGGTSCVEALYKGVPVVTLEYGDVGTNAGKDFWVQDYADMGKKILQYCEDKEYYGRMSEKARKRAEILLDTDTEFVRIMNIFEQREAEREQM